MSDFRKLINSVSESVTSSGAVSTVAMPVGTQRRADESTPEMPQVLEYGNWDNSASNTGKKLKSTRAKASKIVKSIYGEDASEAANPQQQAAIAIAKKEKKDVSEGRFVKGPGGVPLDRQGNPIEPKPPKGLGAVTLNQLGKNKKENPGQSPFKTQDDKVKKYLGLEKQGVAEGNEDETDPVIGSRTQWKRRPQPVKNKPVDPKKQGVAERADWGGPLYDPDLQKGKKKPKLSDIKVKFPPKPLPKNPVPKEQGVAEEKINEMNPMLVRDGLQVVIDFLSQYPQATALTAGAAGTAIVAKLVKNAWRNHKELEQLKQDVRDWSIQKLHSNKNVSAKGGKVAKIIQTEIERRKQGVAEGSGPQKGDPVYYGSRLVGWFLGYSKYGKVITKPNYDEMGDEYANRDVYWDKDAVTIKSDKQGVAEGFGDHKFDSMMSGITDRATRQSQQQKEFVKQISTPDSSILKNEIPTFSEGEVIRIKPSDKASRDYGNYFNQLGMIVSSGIRRTTSFGTKYRTYRVRMFKDNDTIEVSSLDMMPYDPRPLPESVEGVAEGGYQESLDGVSPQTKVALEDQLAEADLIMRPGPTKELGFTSKNTDHEVAMAKNDCYQSAKNAAAIIKMLQDVSEDQGIEGWVASKLTLASDYLNTIREYLEGQELQDHPLDEGKNKRIKGGDPCWDSHEMVGMKKGKSGKPVPNCVLPKKKKK